MSKPDWKDAPEWAGWLTQDKNGTWYWYEFQPVLKGGDDWYWDGRTRVAEIKESEWQSTLEPRQ